LVVPPYHTLIGSCGVDTAVFFGELLAELLVPLPANKLLNLKSK